MTDNRQNLSVDFYFDKEQKWQNEIIKLRSIVLDCPLTEELKWGVACYTYNKSNVVIIHFLKEYVNEAIKMGKSGIKVPVKKGTEFAIPEELQKEFAEMPALKKAFEALTPGRQRAYLLFFSAPKQFHRRNILYETRTVG